MLCTHMKLQARQLIDIRANILGAKSYFIPNSRVPSDYSGYSFFFKLTYS